MEKPESTLNPDQKAAIATLPALEGGLRELEDIAKAVETIEHEHRATARDELEIAKLKAVEIYKVCSVFLLVQTPLTLALNSCSEKPCPSCRPSSQCIPLSTPPPPRRRPLSCLSTCQRICKTSPPRMWPPSMTCMNDCAMAVRKVSRLF